MRLVVVVVLILLVSCGGVFISGSIGVGGWGPTVNREVTVTRTYVDTSKKEGSHYMVATDKGMFEVDNGWLLGVWDADVIYGKMVAGKRYHIVTKGNQIANIFMQEYPYVVAAQQITDVVAEVPVSKKVEVSMWEVVYDLRTSNVPVVVILKDGTKMRFEP